MALKWDDGDSLNEFIKNNKENLVNFDTKTIKTTNTDKVTICEMTRRIVDTLVINDIHESHPEVFEELMSRIKYVYISAKKMQNRISELRGSSDDLWEQIDADYDISNRIERIQKIK
jgi:hypothetical protein